jgi:hypothetical protein
VTEDGGEGSASIGKLLPVSGITSTPIRPTRVIKEIPIICVGRPDDQSAPWLSEAIVRFPMSVPDERAEARLADQRIRPTRITSRIAHERSNDVMNQHLRALDSNFQVRQAVGIHLRHGPEFRHSRSSSHSNGYGVGNLASFKQSLDLGLIKVTLECSVRTPRT